MMTLADILEKNAGGLGLAGKAVTMAESVLPKAVTTAEAVLPQAVGVAEKALPAAKSWIPRTFQRVGRGQLTRTYAPATQKARGLTDIAQRGLGSLYAGFNRGYRPQSAQAYASLGHYLGVQPGQRALNAIEKVPWAIGRGIGSWSRRHPNLAGLALPAAATAAPHMYWAARQPLWTAADLAGKPFGLDTGSLLDRAMGTYGQEGAPSHAGPSGSPDVGGALSRILGGQELQGQDPQALLSVLTDEQGNPRMDLIQSLLGLFTRQQQQTPDYYSQMTEQYGPGW